MVPGRRINDCFPDFHQVALRVRQFQVGIAAAFIGRLGLLQGQFQFRQHLAAQEFRLRTGLQQLPMKAEQFGLRLVEPGLKHGIRLLTARLGCPNVSLVLVVKRQR